MQSPDEAGKRDLQAITPLVYDELREIAARYFRRQPPGFTLCPTDIVHEACKHLIQHGQAEWTSTEHFRAIAAKKMWQIVIDHLKRRGAQKRGGVLQSPRDSGHVGENAGGADACLPRRAWRRISLDAITVEWRGRDVDLLDLADALADLGKESQRLSDVVTLHWFGGMTYQEIAQHLGISPSTAEKDFRYSLAWLNRRLEGSGPDAD